MSRLTVSLYNYYIILLNFKRISSSQWKRLTNERQKRGKHEQKREQPEQVSEAIFGLISTQLLFHLHSHPAA